MFGGLKGGSQGHSMGYGQPMAMGHGQAMGYGQPMAMGQGWD